MELLKDIWTMMSQQWIGAVAFLLALISLAEKIGGIASAVKQWKVRTVISNQFKKIQRKYRLYRTIRVIQAHFIDKQIRISIQAFENCLRERTSTAVRGQLAAITPEKPTWLNDYLMATALETLSNEGKVAKANQYGGGSWPAQPHSYVFQILKTNESAREEAEKLEANSLCSIFQKFPFHQCPTGPRFIWGSYAETTSPGTTTFGSTTRVIEGAPPCGRCWELEPRERNMRLLVENITKHDLRQIATREITGENGEFQRAVITVCTESNCLEEAEPVREIVKQAIDIRRKQLEIVDQSQQTEWTQQLTENFSSCLSAYIKEKSH